MTTGSQGTAARRTSSPLREDKGNFYGIFTMQLSVLFFSTNDVFNKLVGDNLATGQMVLIRGICATVLVFLLCVFFRELKHFAQSFQPTVLIRGLCETLSAICCLIALKNLPLANVSAILLAIPLTTTAAAALLLGEQVGIRRWSAVLIGFIGVLAIVRPGIEGFNFYSIFGLGAVFFAAARDLVTRQIPKGSSLWIVTLATMIVSTLGGGVMTLAEGWFSGFDTAWLAPNSKNLLFLLAAGSFLTLGQYFIAIAMQNGEVSVVSSFRYISMPIALTYGYLIWGEVPDALTWFGILLILASGIYTIFRERKVARLKREGKREGDPDALVAAETGHE
ncbi:DMT family transporter [uncultured Cohaesibacter sp.]|uniref:DMT family transporter n=1 Tax=uncultured Cohaesibacter sp. TaxID=1002546 RepID=UPI002930F3C8|nr:DMT family transporter [uncultured Cohaesibacter sp.]